MRIRTSLIAAFVVGVFGCERPESASEKPRPTPQATANSKTAVLLPGGRSIADVAEQVTPSVVSVYSEKHAAAAGDALAHIFEHHGRAPKREVSLGSGVIVSSDGVIVTNSHVVEQAEKIKVALKDGRTLEAKLVGTDPKSDVAVLRINAKDLPVITAADSSHLRIGDVVLAIGNPFGIGQTVTMGIVSAVGRDNMGITEFDDFIQTDAAINPGNSGGALVNMDGQLVGINTAIVSQTGGYQGIGFAIPSGMAIQIKDALLTHGKVARGWLGLGVSDLTDEAAQILELQPGSGVLVSEVTPGGPAAKAGFEKGDVITAIDTVKTTESGQVRNLIARTARGKQLHVALQRDGKQRTIDLRVAEQPDDVAQVTAPAQTVEDGLFAGVTVRELDGAARAERRIPEQINGVIVTAVDPQGAAAMMLRPGDVILEVNRTATSSVKAFHEIIGEETSRAIVLVYRDGSLIFMSFTS